MVAGGVFPGRAVAGVRGWRHRGCQYLPASAAAPCAIGQPGVRRSGRRFLLIGARWSGKARSLRNWIPRWKRRNWRWIDSERRIQLRSKPKKADLEWNERELARRQQLAGNMFSKANDIDEYVTKVEQDRIAIRKAETDVQIAVQEAARAEAQLNLKILKSPMDGVVTDIKLSPGEFIYEQTPIMTIAQVAACHAALGRCGAGGGCGDVGGVGDCSCDVPLDPGLVVRLGRRWPACRREAVGHGYPLVDFVFDLSAFGRETKSKLWGGWFLWRLIRIRDQAEATGAMSQRLLRCCGRRRFSDINGLGPGLEGAIMRPAARRLHQAVH